MFNCIFFLLCPPPRQEIETLPLSNNRIYSLYNLILSPQFKPRLALSRVLDDLCSTLTGFTFTSYKNQTIRRYPGAVVSSLLSQTGSLAPGTLSEGEAGLFRVQSSTYSVLVLAVARGRHWQRWQETGLGQTWGEHFHWAQRSVFIMSTSDDESLGTIFATWKICFYYFSLK